MSITSLTSQSDMDAKIRAYFGRLRKSSKLIDRADRAQSMISDVNQVQPQLAPISIYKSNEEAVGDEVAQFKRFETEIVNTVFKTDRDRSRFKQLVQDKRIPVSWILESWPKFSKDNLTPLITPEKLVDSLEKYAILRNADPFSAEFKNEMNSMRTSVVNALDSMVDRNSVQLQGIKDAIDQLVSRGAAGSLEVGNRAVERNDVVGLNRWIDSVSAPATFWELEEEVKTPMIMPPPARSPSRDFYERLEINKRAFQRWVQSGLDPNDPQEQKSIDDFVMEFKEPLLEALSSGDLWKFTGDADGYEEALTRGLERADRSPSGSSGDFKEDARRLEQKYLEEELYEGAENNPNLEAETIRFVKKYRDHDMFDEVMSSRNYARSFSNGILDAIVTINKRRSNPGFARRRAASGKGLKIIKGYGIQPESIQEDEYVQLGKICINKTLLETCRQLEVVNQKMRKNPKLSAGTVSDAMKIVLERLLSSRPALDWAFVEKLSQEEKEFLSRLLKTAGVDKTLGFQISGSGSSQDEERFKIVSGEILAGNDNPEIVKELKMLTLRLRADGKITPKKFSSIMEQIVLLQI